MSFIRIVGLGPGDPDLLTLGSLESLRSSLAELWSTMEAELRSVFENCRGFERVADAASFADYLLACEIRTTMPFNDYWTGPPPLGGTAAGVTPARMTGFCLKASSLWDGSITGVVSMPRTLKPHSA